MFKVVQFNPLPVIDYDIMIKHDWTSPPQWRWKKISDVIVLFITCSSLEEVEELRKKGLDDIKKNYYRSCSDHELSIP